MGKHSSRLCFTEEELSASKLTHDIAAAPVNSVLAAAHREVSESEDDNVGVESSHKLEEAAEGGVRAIASAYRSRQIRNNHNSDRADGNAGRTANQAQSKTDGVQNPRFHRNPYSRWRQKQAIKKEYAAVKAGRTSGNIARESGKVSKATRKTGMFVTRHKKGFLIILGIAAVLVIFLNLLSSCSVLVQAGITAVGASTYPNEDNDMRTAEEHYCAMEAELQHYLDTYESTHSFDEYHYELDAIGHDPYVLISAVTALHGGEWKADEIEGTLQLLFEKQYILTETVTSQTRYRTEIRTGYFTFTDPVTGAVEIIPYEYEVQVPYTHRICTVKLENFDLSHVPAYVMTEEQLSMYAVYMERLGNRPDLFSDSAYVDLYYNSEYEDYDIPTEALEDEQFAAMIEEAEKHLGRPYVFGGSKPETSFDCSGFVSWVLNHSGWNIGRLSAEGLRQICTRISLAEAKPGDLIFFEKTYNTPGASHVGIYVGNNMMLHCGDPIQYTSINTTYWQEHFLSFGRLPSP